MLPILRYSKLKVITAPIAGPLTHDRCLIGKGKKSVRVFNDLHANSFIVLYKSEEWVMRQTLTLKNATLFEKCLDISPTCKMNFWHRQPPDAFSFETET